MTTETAAVIEYLMTEFTDALDIADMYRQRKDWPKAAKWLRRANHYRNRLQKYGAVIGESQIVKWPESNERQS